MTVKELIDILQEYPMDALVAVSYTIDVNREDIELMEEFYNGDAANPNCEILENKVVRIGW